MITYRIYESTNSDEESALEPNADRNWVVSGLEERNASKWILKSLVFNTGSAAGWATHLVLAWDQGNVIGYWAYDEEGRQSLGTYVLRKYRRQGIATQMWRFLLRRMPLTEVKATAITRDGRGFLRKMEKSHPLRTSINVW